MSDQAATKKDVEDAIKANDEPFLNTTGGKVVLGGACAAAGAALTYVLMPKPNAEGLKGLGGGGSFSLK